MKKVFYLIKNNNKNYSFSDANSGRTNLEIFCNEKYLKIMNFFL